MPSSVPALAPEPVATAPLMRFLTLGGAVVEVHNHRFRTRYLHGRPYPDKESGEVDGFIWRCLGCAADGESDGADGPSIDRGRYLPKELHLARTDANTHAGQCRAMAPAGDVQ